MTRRYFAFQNVGHLAIQSCQINSKNANRTSRFKFYSVCIVLFNTCILLHSLHSRHFGFGTIIVKKCGENTSNVSSLMCLYFRQSELRTPFKSTQYQWPIDNGWNTGILLILMCPFVSVVSLFQSYRTIRQARIFVRSFLVRHGHCKDIACVSSTRRDLA